ncbi:MAG: hypothetical protein IH946_09590 [Bacteroidetes bacterium]|nr:hypothetical protein [Bacteroidota bacterium]
MRTTQLTLLLVVFMSLLVFQGCKKYEEGPLISLQSKSKRLIGNWVSVIVFIDNTEWPGAGNGSIFYNFKDDGNYHRVFEFGRWEFDKSKEDLLMYPYHGEPYEMNILRLTRKELWLKNVVDGKEYEYHFEKDDK